MLFRKLRSKRTTRQRSGVASLLQGIVGGKAPSEVLEKLEELLLASDIGARTADEIVTAAAERSSRGADANELAASARQILTEHLRVAIPETADDRLTVFLILGVNGVGKTTTIAKLVEWFRTHRGIERISLAAGDTFRAGAVKQLQLHGERLGVRVVSQGEGSDPAAVVYDALESSQARGDQLLIIDTAGRMHNKKHLVEELSKINRIIERRAGAALVQRILVVDSTTGQNALRQAEVFHEAVGVDCAVLTKYDSSARAGIAVPISRGLNVPLAFLGTGEKYGDLREFSAAEYAEEVLA